MDTELTPEQEMLKKSVRDFADGVIRPRAHELDEKGEFPRAIVKQMAELGLMGVAIPERWGGAGLDALSYVLAMEEISRGCASCGVIMSVNNSLYCDPILKFGTDAQREKWLTPYARGEKLGCYALSEPGSGSDAAAMKTVAKRSGNEWILNGTKNFITNAAEANACVLYAMTTMGVGHKGISGFIVPMDAPGVRIGKVEKKLGIKASSTCSIVLEDARISGDGLIGKEGEGFKVAMATLDGGRIGIAAQALGIARAALEEALQYAGEREAFGGPLNQLQAIQFMLADCATELDAARLLTWRAAWLKDRGVRHSQESAMAKLYASEASSRIANRALQIHGGYGYVKDYAAERHWRDARITEIYEGTSEIQRLVIARGVLKG
ncbi:MAG: acyl-CoA dehydrogenase [Deltaproteobacteria bacterium]|nr:acyl-CoA dehydrogenase [Deltaproteobacteria bacterium]